MFLNIVMIIFYVIAIVIICITLEYNQLKKNKKHIAIVQFDERQFDPQLEEKIWSIADWYEFAEMSDREFEIGELRSHYDIVLELI